MISVITPVYNAKDYRDRTMEAVLAQDYPDWEWILVEDGSTDGTREKLKDYVSSGNADPRIHIVFMDENPHGAAGGRNRGLDEAKGRYIAFLDADDIWSPDKLSSQLRFMDETGAAFSFTSYEFGDEDAVGTGKIVKVPESLVYRDALSRTVIFTSTVMFDTEKMNRELLYMPYIASEDTATWWNILRNGITARGLDKVLTIYRRPKKSLSSNKLIAIKRIWNLYRVNEGLGIFSSSWYLAGWAIRATLRRI